jgi:hypothetical protein
MFAVIGSNCSDSASSIEEKKETEIILLERKFILRERKETEHLCKIIASIY